MDQGKDRDTSSGNAAPANSEHRGQTETTPLPEASQANGNNDLTPSGPPQPSAASEAPKPFANDLSRTHRTWAPKYGRVQKCDFCNGRSPGTLHVCATCNLHICENCSRNGRWHTDRKHFIDADACDWEVKKTPKPARGARARRGTTRAASTPDPGAGRSAAARRRKRTQNPDPDDDYVDDNGNNVGQELSGAGAKRRRLSSSTPAARPDSSRTLGPSQDRGPAPYGGVSIPGLHPFPIQYFGVARPAPRGAPSPYSGVMEPMMSLRLDPRVPPRAQPTTQQGRQAEPSRAAHPGSFGYEDVDIEDDPTIRQFRQVQPSRAAAPRSFRFEDLDDENDDGDDGDRQDDSDYTEQGVTAKVNNVREPGTRRRSNRRRSNRLAGNMETPIETRTSTRPGGANSAGSNPVTPEASISPAPPAVRLPSPTPPRHINLVLDIYQDIYGNRPVWESYRTRTRIPERWDGEWPTSAPQVRRESAQQHPHEEYHREVFAASTQLDPFLPPLPRGYEHYSFHNFPASQQGQQGYAASVRTTPAFHPYNELTPGERELVNNDRTLLAQMQTAWRTHPALVRLRARDRRPLYALDVLWDVFELRRRARVLVRDFQQTVRWFVGERDAQFRAEWEAHQRERGLLRAQQGRGLGLDLGQL